MQRVASWNVIVPIKRLDAAKSRLMLGAAGHRERLALAFARDVLSVALRAENVGALFVVTDDEGISEIATRLGAQVVQEVTDPSKLAPDPLGGFPGLNAAIELGSDFASANGVDGGVAALAADLPALRISELEACLEAATHHPRAFTPDSTGLGTSMLTASADVDLAPRFGQNSASRHRESGAFDLSEFSGAGLRLDVDTVDELGVALARGVGPFTALEIGTENLPR